MGLKSGKKLGEIRFPKILGRNRGSVLTSKAGSEQAETRGTEGDMGRGGRKGVMQLAGLGVFPFRPDLLFTPTSHLSSNRPDPSDIEGCRMVVDSRLDFKRLPHNQGCCR